ncbi:MAG TPA: hypothetical protein VHW09_23330 [Bryobacteraceae bacterium]|nr:hypothetical protein [Bryobacteraceae bacterium]
MNSARESSPLARAAYWLVPPLLCLLAHWRGLASWYQSDDFVWLGINLHGHGLHDLLVALFVPGSAGHIRPWSERLIFLVNFALFGLNPLPFRVMVFAMQCADLALVAWLGTRLTGRRAAGFLAAMLWAVSAVTVDPLAWAAANEQVQAALFLLLAFYFLLRYTETGERRYNLYQWLVFVLGFGALEINIVYPALAAVYTFLFARKYLARVLPMFAVSAAYLALHWMVAPMGRDPVYALHFTGAMLRTLAKYWAWSVGPVGFWAPMAVPLWLIPSAVVLVSLGLLAFAVVRGRTAILFLAWFVISIAPVLPLRDHVEQYYAFVPAIGVCWLGGWALTEGWRAGNLRRAAAAALAAVYILIMLPRTVASCDYYDRFSGHLRALVEGVSSAHELHPGKTIALEGIDTTTFYNGVADRPFRLLDIDHVYLTAANADRIDAHPELGDISEFVLPAGELSKELDNDAVVVYDASGPILRNITSEYAGRPRDLAPPHRIDVADPEAAQMLGPEWYAPEGNHRWMPARASLRIGGPTTPGQKLYLHGNYPAGQLRAGPLTMQVTINGSPLAPARLTSGGNFELAFPLPDSLVGEATIDVTVAVNRTFHAGGDIRELGLAFGGFEVR